MLHSVSCGGYGFTIHGSAAVPVPLTAVVPEVREMAGRTPYAKPTSPL